MRIWDSQGSWLALTEHKGRVTRPEVGVAGSNPERGKRGNKTNATRQHRAQVVKPLLIGMLVLFHLSKKAISRWNNRQGVYGDHADPSSDYS